MIETYKIITGKFQTCCTYPK